MSLTPPPLPPPLPPQQVSHPGYSEPEPPAPPPVGQVILSVLLHPLALGILFYRSWSMFPATTRADMRIPMAVGGVIGGFIGAVVIHIILRAVLRSVGRRPSQPLLVLVSYGLVILLPFAFGGSILPRRGTSTETRKAVEGFKKETRKLNRKMAKDLKEEGVIQAKPDDLKARREAWDKTLAQADTEKMSPMERKVFNATRGIVSEIFEHGQKFAELAAAHGAITLDDVQSTSDVLKVKSGAEAMLKANGEFWDYLKGLGTKVEAGFKGEKMTAGEAFRQTQDFLQGMAHADQLEVRRIEDERMQIFITLLDLLVVHDGHWSREGVQFNFEDPQAIEDFNVLLDELSRCERELAARQQVIMQKLQAVTAASP